MPEIVECHSGYTYGERPVAFMWQGTRLEVAEVQAQWRVPHGRCFRVRTLDDGLFELSYEAATGVWHIEPL